MEPVNPPSEATSDDKVVQVTHSVEINAFDNSNVNIEKSNFGFGTLNIYELGHREDALLAENIRCCSGKLATILRTKANEVLQNEKKHSLLDEQHSAAPCSSKQEVIASTYRIGHYHLRRYVHSFLQQLPRSNINYTQLFSAACSQAKQQAREFCRTVPEKEVYELVHGNIVLMVGQAGVGKSAVAKCILDKILNEELYDIDFIFYLDCQNIDCNKSKSILEFLTNDSFIHEICKEFSVELKQILEMLDKSNKVGIILDGVDERMIKKHDEESSISSSLAKRQRYSFTSLQFSKNVDPRPNTTSINDVANAETFIYNLLNGNILPQAKKLITACLQKPWNLHHTYMPKFIVEVLGLNDEGQKQICCYICGEERKMNKIILHLNDHPDLKRYCVFPVYCVLIMFCIHLHFEDTGSDTFTLVTITKIIGTALKLYIEKSQLYQGFQVEELCALAYSGHVSFKFLFDQQDLNREKIQNNTKTICLTTRMSQNINLKLWKSTASNLVGFFHPVMQEFLLALHMVWFADLSTFKKFIAFLDEVFSSSPFRWLLKDYHKMVAKFLFGLCNSTTLALFQKLILPFALNESHLIQKKALIKMKLLEIFKNENFSNIFLLVCSLLFEMRDDQFTADLVTILKEDKKICCLDALVPQDESSASGNATWKRVNRINIKGDIFPGNVASVHYVLQASSNTTPLYLGIFYPNFVGVSMKEFFVQLEATLQSTNILVDYIDLRESITCQDTCKIFLKCLRKTTHLIIGSAAGMQKLSVAIIEMLSDAIKKLQNKLQYLGLSGCCVGDEGLRVISSCLHNVRGLSIGNLKDDQITQQGIKDLTKAILSNSMSLESVSLYCKLSFIDCEVKAMFQQCKSKNPNFRISDSLGQL